MSLASSTGEALRERANEAYDKVGDSVQRAKDRVELPIHRHPVETVLVAAGCGILMGFVLGFLSHRRSD